MEPARLLKSFVMIATSAQLTLALAEFVYLLQLTAMMETTARLIFAI